MENSDDGEGVPENGPHRWYSLAREFRAYLKASPVKGDAAIAAHVERVCLRIPEGDARTKAVVWVDYGVWEDDKLQHAGRLMKESV